MKLWVGRILRTFLVLVGIVLLTSFTIDATDNLSGSQSALSFLAKTITTSSCPAGMLEVSFSDRSICVDAYENSFSSYCPVSNTASALDTQNNLNETSCTTVSQAGKLPAVFVTMHQAQTFCARRGGRLPTAYEWYDAALGTPDTHCNLHSSLAQTGTAHECISARGLYDSVGNAWEWTDSEVRSGTFEGRTMPATGFVQEADRAGVATVTGSSPNTLFNNDYFWSKDLSNAVMMRGGFYDSGEEGGIYSIHADIEPSFASAATGFRCVVDL